LYEIHFKPLVYKVGLSVGVEVGLNVGVEVGL
jgi:hypothetical protein